jgi:Na+-driven multidrug efflux pump
VLVSFLNSLLAAYSQGYVVILGIYYKLQTFLYLPAGGIVQGMRPLISYNYGAGEHGRVKKIYNLAMGMNAAIMAAGTIICLVGSPALIGMFTTNADTIAAGQVALRIISAGFLVSTLSVTASGSLEALGKGTQSLIISLCRYIIIMIPAAWILCRLFGPVGVWHAFWVTELLSALAAAFVYKHTVKLNV